MFACYFIEYSNNSFAARNSFLVLKLNNKINNKRWYWDFNIYENILSVDINISMEIKITTILYCYP